MDKKDVPRLRNFLGILMRTKFSDMPGKDMVQLVNDMTWVAKFADKLDVPAIKVVKESEPIEKRNKKK